MRNLVLILGDQLDHNSEAFRNFEDDIDRIWMAEVADENTHVWCHKLRIAYFLSAMRHFRDELTKKNRRVEYHELRQQPSQDRGRSFPEVLTKDVQRLKPRKLIVVQPGDFRVQQQLQQTADSLGIGLEIRADQHFYCSTEDFAEYADCRKSLLLEFFYRHLREKHDILMAGPKQPEGGQWNFDHDNRESFGRSGPRELPEQKTFRPDNTTKKVIALVETRFADHPGNLDHFTVPVTRRQAKAFLRHFIDHMLPSFGRWEDAMWTDEAFLYHSRLSASLNMKLLNPRECVAAAVDAYHSGRAPLNSVEGFVRQILGWREFVRGVYWLKMPEYADMNYFDHHRELPSFFWDGKTEMNCVAESMKHVLNHGYSHHIHRLMVLGNFAQLWGAHPKLFHDWHMAMYLDAVDWVSLPNTLGMSQYGDGGIVGTKPYCSSGNYINNMSNFCKGCRFDYRKRTGDDACPFTTLYWEFMDRHYDQLKDNMRMKFPIRNVEKLRQKADQMTSIRDRADALRMTWNNEDS
ncbi:MAG: cryptochrome/photolyase family protein [Planctomycetaceae bacterium]